MSTRDDAIRQAYLKWRLPLFRFLRRRVGNDADAEDITQDAFSRWLAAKSAAAPERPRAYVTQIAVNAWQESAGKRLHRPGVVVSLDAEGAAQHEPVADAGVCPERLAEHRQTLARLQQALQELPALQREAFTLHRFDGLSYEEIALRLRISRASVSKYISRSLAYCRLRVDFPSQQAMQCAQRKQDPDGES